MLSNVTVTIGDGLARMGKETIEACSQGRGVGPKSTTRTDVELERFQTSTTLINARIKTSAAV
jgi:hypothetical protein